MVTATAPQELAQVGLDPSRFTRSDQKSWRGPCPRCGGTRRFVIFINGDFPHWRYACDGCGHEGWIDQLNPALAKPTPEQQAQWAERERVAQAARDTERRRRLDEFASQAVWREYHECMTDDNRLWWEKQGIPRDWQNFWRLGYKSVHRFEHNDQFYERPAYVIPKFELGWRAVNMDFRIVDPPDGVGKYRPMAGLPPAVFLTRPDFGELSRNGRLYICEGSKKAMVTSTRLDDEQVVGVPSCNSWAGAESLAKGLERVFIILDPDAGTWALKMARAVGAAARIVTLPTKIDDAFISYGLTSHNFHAICKQARKG